MELPEKILSVVSNFKKLPGVGEKTALRQTLMLTNWNASDLIGLGESILNLSNLKTCEKCGMYAETTLCSVCNSDRIKSKTICIVESVMDLIAIEQSGEFREKYHVLGGSLNPLLGIGPHDLKIDELVSRIVEENVRDVILAINSSVEGDATCSYIKEVIPADIKVERIGFGIPMGGSLEYLDALTISKALENRRTL